MDRERQMNSGKEINSRKEINGGKEINSEKEISSGKERDSGTETSSRKETNSGKEEMNSGKERNLGRDRVRGNGMRKMKMLQDYRPAHEIFSLFSRERDAVFLDSSLENELGRWSIIGRRPYLKLVNGETFTVNGEAVKESFEEYVKAYLNQHKEENPTNLPFLSGAIGYFAYDYGRKLEGLKESENRKNPAGDIPYCILNFYEEFIMEDLAEKKVWLIANGCLGDAGQEIEELETMISQSAAMKPAKASDKAAAVKPAEDPDEKDSVKPAVYGAGGAPFTPDFTKDEYLKAVQDMIDYIVEGDIYIANMTQNLTVEGERDPYEVFCRLREANPSPFGGYMDYGDFQIVSASPERFLKLRQGIVETRPIKGTRRRGSTPKEDAELKDELKNSEKDKSELLMIVDLERNDLNKVCVPGSVRVTELFGIETYATVFHLVASITGKLAEGKNAADLLMAAFPGGSITGAPKRRAMELIEELEHTKRGLYTGSIGYIGLDGSCDLNIVIRTAVFRKGMYSLGVGGGITCESDTEFEYEETLQKAKAVLEAIG